MALNFSALLKPSHMINNADINRLQQGPNPANTLRQQPARPRQAGGGTLMQPGVPPRPGQGLNQQNGQGKATRGGVFGRFLRARHEPVETAAHTPAPRLPELSELHAPLGAPGDDHWADHTQAQLGGVNDAPPPPPRVNIGLNEKGQAHFSVPDNHPPFDRLLNVTLGRAEQSYQGQDSRDGQQVLLDTRGRLVSLQQTPLHMVGMVNSQIFEEPVKTRTGRMPGLPSTTLENHQVRLSADPQQAEILTAGGRPASIARLPDAATQSQLTGVYRHATASGEQALRLHEKTLYRHDPQANEWKKHDASAGKMVQLSQQGNGHLYAVSDETALLDITSGKSITAPGKIAAISLDAHGRAALLTSDKTTHQQQLSFYPHINGPLAAAQKIAVTPANLALSSLALHNHLLFATDTRGNLFQARLPVNGAQAMTFEPAPAALTRSLSMQFGQGVRVESLFVDDQQQLHAKLKDMQNQEHAVTLSGNRVTSNWSLSDSMVVDNQQGLPRPQPEDHAIMDFGPLGKMALHDGKVHYLDRTTQRWVASKESAEQLRRGQDGQPWILNEGELRRLKVNLTSDEIQHNSSLFDLGRVKNSVKADLPAAGLDKKQNTVAVDALGEGRFVALNDSGDVHFHQVNKDNRRDARGTQTLKADDIQRAITALQDNGKAGKMVDMALGENQQLYLLSDQGAVFSLPSSAWQKGTLAGLVREEVPPADQPAPDAAPTDVPKYTSLGHRGADNLLLSDEHGNQATLHAGVWQKGLVAHEEQPQERVAEQVFQRLEVATKDRHIPGSRITVKREVNVFGSTGQDGLKVQTPFKSRVRAFLFKPTLETPRPVKNAGYFVQHGYAGREGLRPVYQQQGELLNRLRELDPAKGTAGAKAPRAPLTTRIDALDWTGNEALKRELLSFSQDLADSAAHHAGLLGQHYGVVDTNNQPLLNDSKTRNAQSGRFNPASTRDGELTESLNRMLHVYPSSPNNVANGILATMEMKKVVINHQKPEVPFGKQRDSHDDVGLVKSQLILTSLTQADMHNLLTEVQQAMAKPEAEKAAAMIQIGSKFNELRDFTWGENSVKKAAAMGFVNNRGLEANYDAIKSMTKAFSKEDHGVHVTSRKVMSANDKVELNRRMKATVLSLESGEDITFNRAYGAAATGTMIPGAQGFASPGARLNVDRSYSLNFSRTETGINVSFGRNGGGSATVFGAAGYNMLTDYLHEHKTALDSERTLSPGFRLGGTVSAMLQRQMQNGISFGLTEAELPAFLDALTEGNLDPQTLMDKGMDHTVKNGNTLRVSVDINAAAVASVGLPITTDAEKTSPTSARLGGGVYAGANLLNGTRERTTSNKEISQQQTQSDNRLRAFNQFNAGANFAIPVGVNQKTGDETHLPLFAGGGVSIQASVDNRTRQSINLQLKDAQPLADVHLDKLMKTLGDQFPDPATNKLMDDLKEDETRLPADKLKALMDHFKPQLEGKEMQGNGQREAILQLSQNHRQQKMAERKGKEIGSAEYRSSYGNLGKLDSNSFFHSLFHMVSTRPSDSNADRIAKLMDEDPRLKLMIRELQENSSTEAVVTLELNEQQKAKMAADWLAGGTTPDQMLATLSNSDNLRIKSIGFTRSQSKGDGFATPAFLLGGSNSASVSMSVNLGKINFSYGENQLDPTGFTLEGKMTRPDEEVSHALTATQKQGFVLKG